MLNKPELEYAISPIVPQKNRYQSYERYGYGLGWEQSVLNDEELVSRFGGYSGIASHLSFHRDKNIGIVVLSNQKGLESLGHLVANFIYNSLLGKENKNEIVKENLLSLKRNVDNEAKQKTTLLEAAQGKFKNKPILKGKYDGSDKSGTMYVDKSFTITWGNLKGHIYSLTDTTGIIDFGSMIRTVQYEWENGKFVGLYSNDRYFKKLDP